MATDFSRAIQMERGRFNQHKAANENSSGHFLVFCDEIQAIIHSIDKIDITKPRRTEHNRIARRFPAGGMTGRIILTYVSFRFCNEPCSSFKDHDFAKKFLGNSESRAAKEISRKSFSHDVSKEKNIELLFEGFSAKLALHECDDQEKSR